MNGSNCFACSRFILAAPVLAAVEWASNGLEVEGMNHRRRHKSICGMKSKLFQYEWRIVDSKSKTKCLKALLHPSALFQSAASSCRTPFQFAIFGLFDVPATIGGFVL